MRYLINFFIIFFLYGFTSNNIMFEIPPKSNIVGDRTVVCIQKAIANLSQIMPPNRFYFSPADTVIISNIFGDKNLYAVMFSRELLAQSYLTPSAENNSAILHFRSLLKKQCPNISQSVKNYNYPYNEKYIKYILLKINDK